jgi:hypothetical protein
MKLAPAPPGKPHRTLPLRMVQASATAAAEQPRAAPILASVGSRSRLAPGPPSAQGAKERETSDLSRLSNAELIQRLADQSRELGIGIDLNYSFAQPPKPKE